ncbi:Hypothetical protein R9X50_00290600 [Acrodontium crateriforme]|uniref:COP9 signalosome complex subunit 3 N-terminal helical repeats domain-containing protein n=1 Tax=Acrodontium crateriforme TaxID=150365 RepID=A0AAQ3M4S8_9PEZI|nr:Hypothetical protein R9X50_00290600 [Acrodontium crateriforme]
MADVLATLKSFPTDTKANLSPKVYNVKARNYLDALSKISSSAWTQRVGKQSLLDTLDPAVHSIAYMHALLQHISVAGKDKGRLEALLACAVTFFSSFDPVQIRYASEEWGKLLTWLFDGVSKVEDADFGILSTAMLRLDPTGGTFTSYHLRLVRLCLEAGQPSQALPVLNKNIYAFPQNLAKITSEEILCEENDLSNWFITPRSGFTTSLSAEQILEYYLLGAQVYIGQRNWSRARLFLEFVLLTPSPGHVPSALQVEAYKKWILIGLLDIGRVYPLPKTIDPFAVKSIKTIAKSYECLGEDFDKRDWKKYQAELDIGTQIWVEDGNLTLAKEAGDAILRYRVIDLQKTFAALPVSRVAYNLDLPRDHTRQLLTTMISEGHLHASLNENPKDSADPVLRFNYDPPVSSTPEEQDEELKNQTKRVEELVMFIRDADRRLQLSKEYVESQRRIKRSFAGPDGDLADQMDLTWDAPAAPLTEDGDEEDIMAL